MYRCVTCGHLFDQLVETTEVIDPGLAMPITKTPCGHTDYVQQEACIGCGQLVDQETLDENLCTDCLAFGMQKQSTMLEQQSLCKHCSLSSDDFATSDCTDNDCDKAYIDYLEHFTVEGRS